MSERSYRMTEQYLHYMVKRVVTRFVEQLPLDLVSAQYIHHHPDHLTQFLNSGAFLSVDELLDEELAHAEEEPQ